jgi:ABC-type sulfate transport system permease component
LLIVPPGGIIGGKEEELDMKLRIAMWAGVGALVVVFWSFYIGAISATTREVPWALVYLTCPISLGHHHPQTFYFVLLVNAATYALVGATVEMVRRRHRRLDLKHS